MSLDEDFKPSLLMSLLEMDVVCLQNVMGIECINTVKVL